MSWPRAHEYVWERMQINCFTAARVRPLRKRITKERPTLSVRSMDAITSQNHHRANGRRNLPRPVCVCVCVWPLSVLQKPLYGSLDSWCAGKAHQIPLNFLICLVNMDLKGHLLLWGEEKHELYMNSGYWSRLIWFGLRYIQNCYFYNNYYHNQHL